MRASFSFNLPEQTEEYELYRQAPEYFGALCDLYLFLRQDYKYGENKYKEVTEKFWEILKERDLAIP